MKKETLKFHQIAQSAKTLNSIDTKTIKGGIGNDDAEVGIGSDDAEVGITNTDLTTL